MIVCLCRAVSDKKVLSVIQEGASTVREVTAKCGAGGDCGACRSTIAGMIMEHRVHAHAAPEAAKTEEQTGAAACAGATAPVVGAAA